MGRAGEEDSAFAHRDGPYNFVAAAMWEDPEEDEHIRWAGEFWEAMRPFSTGGVYVNFLDKGEEDRVEYSTLLQLS
jgi:hypothetical protein